jgi:hypothetical protein
MASPSQVAPAARIRLDLEVGALLPRWCARGRPRPWALALLVGEVMAAPVRSCSEQASPACRFAQSAGEVRDDARLYREAGIDVG